MDSKTKTALRILIREYAEAKQMQEYVHLRGQKLGMSMRDAMIHTYATSAALWEFIDSL